MSEVQNETKNDVEVKNLVGKKIIDNYGRSGIITEVHHILEDASTPSFNVHQWLKIQKDKRVQEYAKSAWVSHSPRGRSDITRFAPLELCELRK